MDSVKNRGRNKFSSCFNPIVDKDKPCFHSASPPPLFSDAGESCRRKKTPHRSLSGFVKAFFFKTPLLKKLWSKRSKRDSYRSNINISSKIKKLTKKKKIPSDKKFSDRDEEVYNFQDMNSDRSSLFSSTTSSSSRASSLSSNSTSGSERIKALPADCLDLNQTSTGMIRRHAMKLVSSSGKCGSRGLMFVVLVCLVALVFWGKAFAIVTCTSAWLFLVPGRAGPPSRGPQANNDADNTVEYKKRVIIEGLLERNIRSRVVQ